MKKLFLGLLLILALLFLFGCSPTPEVGDTIPKEELTVMFGEGALQFKYRWSSEFFQEWFAATSEWPTQDDVDAWEAKKR